MKNISILVILMAVVFAACKKGKQNPPVPTPVIADFAWSGALTAPANITFENLSSGADSYEWDFGNGKKSVSKQPSPVIFDTSGTYTVALVAKGTSGSHRLSKTIVINEGTSPVANFDYAFVNGRSVAPATVSFTNISKYATNYLWQVDNMHYAVKEIGELNFYKPGIHWVKLSAYNRDGSVHTYEVSFEVLASDEPVSRFQLEYHPFPYQLNEEIQLVNRSENSDSWNWNFGDGSPESTEQHPRIRYTKAGTYTITLIAGKNGKRAKAYSINLKIG